MRYIATLFITLMITTSHTALASDFYYKTGIIKAVDMNSSTFTVILDGAGITEIYHFPDNFRYIENGVKLDDKSLVEPGQRVKLKFSGSGTSVNKESKISGMIVELDLKTGAGTIREEKTNRLVPFRLTQDLMDKKNNVLKTGTVVEFTYTRADRLTAGN